MFPDTRSAGLRYVDVGKPLPETADRTKGYDIALVAVLDEAKDALIYAHHPAHEKWVHSDDDIAVMNYNKLRILWADVYAAESYKNVGQSFSKTC